MALRIAIDTNGYADFRRGVEDAVIAVQRAREIYVPFVVLGELRGGFRYGDFEEENETTLKQFLCANRVAVLFADEATTQIYASIYSDMRRRGSPIPTNDMWIAALAIQHDLVLLTRDRHFDSVPRLARM